MALENSRQLTVEEARRTHHEPVVRRVQDYQPEMGRFGNATQMVFHPTPDDPTEPNAGVLTYLPGAGFRLHQHDFAQVWYVIEGSCRFGEHDLQQGNMVYMADPHFEYEMHTDSGCKLLFVQYPGPTTGERPIYQGRFNVTTVKDPGEEDLRH